MSALSTAEEKQTANEPQKSILFPFPPTVLPILSLSTDKLASSFNNLHLSLTSEENKEDEEKDDGDPGPSRLTRPIKQIKRLKRLEEPYHPPIQMKIQSPPTPQESHQKQPYLEQAQTQTSRQHVFTLHTLPSFNASPKESPPLSPVEENITTMEEQLAECFQFSPQEENPSHSLASVFYRLESQLPSTEWRHLTVLNLSRQNLSQLDHLNQFFSFLELLDISHNELKTLSDLPTSLIHLYACDNKLTEIYIGNLDKLQHVDIAHNMISSFEDLSRLKSLRVVDASHNAISSCRYFQDLPGLTKISLRNNCIRRLNNLTRCPQLETLDVSFNRIECLDSIENLTELRNLNAEHNDIKYVQLNQTMERLCKLQLSFNRLKSFDVSPFPEIRTLYLDDNTIQRIIGIACIPRIESFSLRDQGGTKVEYNLLYLRGVRKLYLSGSPFNSMDRLVDFYSLEYLELCAADIEALPMEFSKHVPNLSTLYLSVNRISDIRSLRKLKYLKRLVLIENRLISVNEVISVIQHLKQLNYLDLRQNPISTNIYPPVNIKLIQDQKDKVSPYVSSALDDSWEAHDDLFRSTLSPQWSTRRKVYRALLAQKCSKLIELDHVRITQQDRQESELIIDNYRKTQTS